MKAIMRVRGLLGAAKKINEIASHYAATTAGRS